MEHVLAVGDQEEAAAAVPDLNPVEVAQEQMEVETAHWVEIPRHSANPAILPFLLVWQSPLIQSILRVLLPLMRETLQLGNISPHSNSPFSICPPTDVFPFLQA